MELTKYNVQEATLAAASEIEKWVFFLRYADRYDAERLRELLPEVPFQQAISAAEGIAGRTEDRMMYDQREKIQMLEQLLGDPPTPADQLSKRRVAELRTLVTQLQERLRYRGA